MILKAFGISVSKICNYSLYYFFFPQLWKKSFYFEAHIHISTNGNDNGDGFYVDNIAAE